MALADEITLRMRALGMSPKRLSLAAGLNESFVRDVLSGRTRSPRWDNLRKLSEALGCSIAELTRSADPMAAVTESGSTNPTILRQAYAVAARVMADEKGDDKGERTAAIAAAVYDVLIERSRSGRPIADEDETLALIESLIRRIRRM